MTLTPLLTASPAIQLHVICAVLAIVIGPMALFRLSRDRLHRLAGRVWIVAMFATALTSLFIHETRIIGPFSPIHLLSVVTFVGLAQGIRHLVRRNHAAHGRAMRALYLQALVIAGVFTFLPGRRMNEALFSGSPELGFVLALAFGAIVLALIWFAPGLRRSVLPR